MSTEDNVKFISMVEKYPCLYNPNMMEYSQKYAVEGAWRDVATEFNLSIRECKKKWKNIRTVFRRHLSSKSGVPPKKNYYLHNELQFLIPIFTSLPNKRPLSSVVENHPDTEILGIKVEDEGQEEEQDFLENYVSDLDSPQPEVNQFIPSSNKRKFEEDGMNTFVTENNCHTRKTRETNGSSSSEADDQFLLSLKWDLGEMNSKQKRLFKKGVYDLINDIMESDNDSSL